MKEEAWWGFLWKIWKKEKWCTEWLEKLITIETRQIRSLTTLLMGTTFLPTNKLILSFWFVILLHKVFYNVNYFQVSHLQVFKVSAMYLCYFVNLKIHKLYRKVHKLSILKNMLNAIIVNDTNLVACHSCVIIVV